MAQRPERHIRIVILTIILVILTGTLGYMILTGQDVLNCLYMTVTTITTVGYREMFKMTPGLQIFTILLIFAGVGTIFYGTSILMQMAVEGQILTILGRRKMEKEIKKLKDHYIIAGFGRVGQIVFEEFKKRDQPVVIIERDPKILEELRNQGLPHLEGDATEDDILLAAGIDRAKALISAIPSEADNVYLALSARQLNPKLKIIARSDMREAEKKLYRAGADKVICPHKLGGMRMAFSTLRPNVVDFMEIETTDQALGISIEEVIVPEGSNLNGVMLKDSALKQRLDLMVVAIKKPEKGIHFNPSAETKIETGDTLILIGNKEKLAQLDLMNAVR